ncbi:MAG: hypothetical protein HUU06_05515 [Planctomycetaceae bacterium]|nr:hypothetical protein [Planctomycetota bacterium]NUN52232.1 hypothetical protein [Planctomycetaceae bacterium]
MKQSWTYFCTLFTAAGAAMAAGGSWTHDSGSGGNATLPVDCGAILGTAGATTQWAAYESSAARIGTHANLGAEWNGGEPMHGTAAPVQTDNSHCHEWTKEGGGSAAFSTLRAEVEFREITPTGSASPLNPEDPSWWWMPHVIVHQDTPSVQRYNPDTGNWDSQSWVSRFGPTDERLQAGWSYTGSMASSHGGPTPGKPTVTTTPGQDRATFSFPPSPHGRKYRVKFPFTVDADADNDNSKALDWKERAHVDCESEVDGSNPNAW